MVMPSSRRVYDKWQCRFSAKLNPHTMRRPELLNGSELVLGHLFRICHLPPISARVFSDRVVVTMVIYLGRARDAEHLPAAVLTL